MERWDYMLDIIIPSSEYYDEEKNEFFNSKEVELHMEHSLISISKWESKWHRAFMTNRKRTAEETLDYFRCMTINKVDPSVFNNLTKDNVEEIIDYINAPMTATYISQSGQPAGSSVRGDVKTSELIYYYMISLGIPFECEKWHINRLLALIHVCEVKNSGGKSGMSKADISRRYRSLNAARRKRYNTSG